MTCPKCGETRLIERVDTHLWFCAVCAHSWTIRPKIVSRESVDAKNATRKRSGNDGGLPWGGSHRQRVVVRRPDATARDEVVARTAPVPGSIFFHVVSVRGGNF
jgi:hypothetical protein